MKAAGLIFSNLHDRIIPELTSKRTMASIPFGARYRLVDFTLSNMANSGIGKVGIITHNNYRSLMEHIGNGKDWDLAGKSGGVSILPPFITAFDNPRANMLYSTRLEALMGVMDYIGNCREELIVLSDSDLVCNIDLSEVIEYHTEKSADVTVVTTNKTLTEGKNITTQNIIFTDENSKITDFLESTPMMSGDFDVSTNIMVINKQFLLMLLNISISHGYKGFYQQALPFLMYNSNYYAYKYEGYVGTVENIAKYYKTNMEMLSENIREKLFSVKERPILTKVRNSPPTRYGDFAVAENSLVADGCTVDGTVENSIIFRGVKIKKGAVIKNSVILQNSVVGEDVKLNCVVCDKNVVILDGRNLSGHEKIPFFIGKGKII